MPDTCASCGYQDGASRDPRPLITVIDPSGSEQLCALCAMGLLNQPGLTLVLAGAATRAAG